MILHQNRSFLANSRQSRYIFITQNSKHLHFLLSFLTLEYQLILEIRLKFFQKYVVSSKKGKALKRERACEAFVHTWQQNGHELQHRNCRNDWKTFSGSTQTQTEKAGNYHKMKLENGQLFCFHFSLSKILKI